MIQFYLVNKNDGLYNTAGLSLPYGCQMTLNLSIYLLQKMLLHTTKLQSKYMVHIYNSKKTTAFTLRQIDREIIPVGHIFKKYICWPVLLYISRC